VSVATAVPVSEYLSTSYRPDCDYLEGELLERNVGERDHSLMQMALSGYLWARRKQFGITVMPEQRVQVKSNQFRVPDVTVIAGPPPATGIITEPPFLCIEILSPDDTFGQMWDRINDYLSFGVQYVWVVDPRSKRAFIYTDHGFEEAKDGCLTTHNPDIRVPISELE
jgi:Uma2 family endonuclease